MSFPVNIPVLAAAAGLIFVSSFAGTAQEPAAKPTVNSEVKAALPFQIELLDTHVRFEANGDWRKEVHTIVEINDVQGAMQFARLTFDYNRGWQQLEIPLVRVTHANGGTSELLPGAVTDAPNPAVEKYPAYQDVRVKGVRILGLQEGDTIEYRVITTTAKAPLSPDFWLEHTFDRSEQVLQENYALDLPGHLNLTTDMRGPRKGSRPGVYLAVPPTAFRNSGEGKDERSIYEWKISAGRKLPAGVLQSGTALPDVIVSSFADWMAFSRKMASQAPSWTEEDGKMAATRFELLGPKGAAASNSLEALYLLVAQKISTVDLPIGANGYRIREAKEILLTGYATPIEKCFLLERLIRWKGLRGEVLFYGPGRVREQFPRPSALDHVFVGVLDGEKNLALDPSSEVAPFGVIASQYRGKEVLTLVPHDHGDDLDEWTKLPERLPFRSFQKVAVSARLGDDGKLSAKVKYTLRGDNELLLRVAFHQTVTAKWKDVAGLLALSDGFRGVITSATASDPLATAEPFTVEYELTQAKFVDWAKTPVRIPALLPQIGLPDATDRLAGQIVLGTPLDVETQVTLRLPGRTTVEAPAGTTVQRDYATYVSKYSSSVDSLTALRHIHFLRRELAADRQTDYGAFVQAVQNDQSQFFVMDRASGVKSTAP